MGGFLHKTHFSISKRVLTFHRKKIRRIVKLFHLSNVEKYRGYRSEYADSLPPHLKSGETLLISPQMKTQLQKLVTLNLPDNCFACFFCDYLTRVSEVQSLKILATDRRKDCGVLQVQQRQTSLFLKT